MYDVFKYNLFEVKFVILMPAKLTGAHCLLIKMNPIRAHSQ